MADQDDAGRIPPRRRFIGNISRAAMVTGLAGGYGAFGLIAGRYLYPSRAASSTWQFVVEVRRLSPGDSLEFEAPSGERINIARQGSAGEAEDFVALSSTCPHLGCQVHWEPQNDRFFCPCHSGVFNRFGVATAGPPADAGQSLPEYPLRIEDGLLFVQVPEVRLAEFDAGQLKAESTADRGNRSFKSENIRRT